FAEYLSLSEVPDAVEGAPPPAPPSGDRWVPPDSELVPSREEPEAEREPQPADPEAPVAAGTLRAPWRWEKLLVDAAVIGGRDRWAKRLSGLKNSLERNLADVEDEAKAAMLQRELADLSALSAFALPLLDALAALPSAA